MRGLLCFGLLVVLDAALGLNPCVCNRVYAPVCGSDGKTYSNECILHCEMSKTPGLHLAYRSPCAEYRTTSHCPCNRMYRPVCGSNGKTYANPCLLNCDKKQHPELKVAHAGPCRPIRMANLKQNQEEFPCQCGGMGYQPVCGNNDQTYANGCVLRCKSFMVKVKNPFAALNHKGLEISHNGPCGTETDCECSLDNTPVCGSDGKTYKNICKLNCEMKNKNELSLLSVGECVTTASQLIVNPVDPPCICELEYKPVCGTDGKTYPNICSLKCEVLRTVSKNPLNVDLKPLTILHEGSCNPELYQLNVETPCACTFEYNPVCGSDGQTYGNPCMLKCEMKKNAKLSLAYGGACVQALSKNEDGCTCTFDLNPVCGSNGETYANPCLLRCEAKKHPEITLAHFGECAESVEAKNEVPCICTFELNPVCGSDGKTYSNPCMLKCEMKNNPELTLAHHGSCYHFENFSSCICTEQYEPVCGSDGKTYPNRCVLRCAAMKNHNLKEVSQDICSH